MISEKKFSLNPEELVPTMSIEKSTDAPPKSKENPFYDPEIWGCANEPFELFLPDSDEAISFAIAAHEIGHVLKRGKKHYIDLDDFDAARAEEQRAWDKGWTYMRKYIPDYYKNNPEIIPTIEQAFERIKNLAMQVTDASESMYLKKGTLKELSYEKKNKILKERRKKIFSEKGKEIKKYYDDIKKEKNGVKPDWDRFTAVVQKAIKDVLVDNIKEQ